MDYNLTVVLPKRSAYFAKSDNQKTKNDKEDSKMLAQMGIEKFGRLNLWIAPSPYMRELRQLVHYRSQLVNHRSQFKQQLHALTNVCTINGLGIVSAAAVITETYGFPLFLSIPQLVSYAGYDVVENQSGKRIGKTKISKKGNSHIRAALHFFALCAVKNEPNIKVFYERIYKRNPKIKMIGYVAVQRKLLVLIYTLYRKNVSYDLLYEQQKEQSLLNKSRQSVNPACTA